MIPHWHSLALFFPSCFLTASVLTVMMLRPKNEGSKKGIYGPVIVQHKTAPAVPRLHSFFTFVLLFSLRFFPTPILICSRRAINKCEDLSLPQLASEQQFHDENFKLRHMFVIYLKAPFIVKRVHILVAATRTSVALIKTSLFKSYVTERSACFWKVPCWREKEIFEFEKCCFCSYCSPACNIKPRR